MLAVWFISAVNFICDNPAIKAISFVGSDQAVSIRHCLLMSLVVVWWLLYTVACTQVQTLACFHSYIHTHTHAVTHSYPCMHTCTHAHTCTHTHKHTHTHEHTHTQRKNTPQIDRYINTDIRYPNRLESGVRKIYYSYHSLNQYCVWRNYSKTNNNMGSSS